jgi:hypothetical protein
MRLGSTTGDSNGQGSNCQEVSPEGSHHESNRHREGVRREDGHSEASPPQGSHYRASDRQASLGAETICHT